MTRLRRSSCLEPGYRRQGRGRGFCFLDPAGTRVTDPAVLARLRGLVVPPAWRDVWLCMSANGHLQAVGTDAAGRRQYLYHPAWRERQDRGKFDRILAFAHSLPEARLRTLEDLGQAGYGREKVLSAALRLLDRGLFRVGGESYATDNGSFGLATLLRSHVRVAAESGEMAFCYMAKSGQEWESRVVDPTLAPIIRGLRNRRSGGDELLAWRVSGGRWHDVTSAEINDHIKTVIGPDYSAKDFRTWHATVLAAVGLAVSAPASAFSATARRRAVARVVREVAEHLGNTPAVCRSSYIDPRVVDRFGAGETIVDALGALAGPETPEGNVLIESAVLDLIGKPPA